jgi:hypothetical protein
MTKNTTPVEQDSIPVLNAIYNLIETDRAFPALGATHIKWLNHMVNGIQRQVTKERLAHKETI